jgi:hypothetical protein
MKPERTEMDSMESATLITKPERGSLLSWLGPCLEVSRTGLGAMAVRDARGNREREDC